MEKPLLSLLVVKNLCAKECLKFKNAITKEIYELVNKLVEENNGSFSAEHGIGMIKKNSFKKFKSYNEIKVMKSIKISLDSKNILNPGKIFDLD